MNNSFGTQKSKFQERPQATSYSSEFVRKRLLEKSFKGNEKGYKSLGKLSETLHTGMEVLWRQNLMCDVVLVTTDGKRIPAHRLVLATCSDYFYELFLDSSNADYSSEIELDAFNGHVLETAVEAMYTGRMKIEAKNVDDLLAAGHVLGMFHILEACECFLLEYITKENCIQLLETSMKYSLTHLTDKALEIAAINFRVISKKTGFKRLSVENMIPMLKRDDLDVDNELEVFQSVVQWINDDRQNRLQSIGDVMGTIRLPLLTPAEVVDNVERCSYLMDTGNCQRLVKEALHYHLMPARQSLLQSPRTAPRCKSELCLLAIGGSHRLNTDPVSDDVMRLNHMTNAWDHVTKLPEPRHHHAVAVVNGFLYVAGGDASQGECDPVSTVHRFDPRQETWLQVASMNRRRQSFQIGVLNGTMYAVGGRASQNRSLNSVERYDPSRDQWDEVTPLAYARRCAAVCVHGGKLYAAGGSNEKAVSSRVERYSHHDNRWETMRPIHVPRFFGYLVPFKDHLYLVGGATIDESGTIVCVPQIERYSVTTGQWTVVSEMRTPRSEFGCTYNKEKIYLLGGYNWNARERPRDVECFAMDVNSWSTLPEMDRPLTGSAAAMLTLFHRKKDQENKPRA